MTPEQIGQFLREFGLPVLVVVLMIFEILVPRGRLKREEARSDKAMDIAEQQTTSMRELTAIVKTWMDAQRGK